LIALPLSQAGPAPVAVLSAAYLVAGAAAIYTLELRWSAPLWATVSDGPLQVSVRLGEAPAAENSPA
jgi:hypothetical protein